MIVYNTLAMSLLRLWCVLIYNKHQWVEASTPKQAYQSRKKNQNMNKKAGWVYDDVFDQ